MEAKFAALVTEVTSIKMAVVNMQLKVEDNHKKQMANHDKLMEILTKILGHERQEDEEMSESSERQKIMPEKGNDKTENRLPSENPDSKGVEETQGQSQIMIVEKIGSSHHIVHEMTKHDEKSKFGGDGIESWFLMRPASLVQSPGFSDRTLHAAASEVRLACGSAMIPPLPKPPDPNPRVGACGSLPAELARNTPHIGLARVVRRKIEGADQLQEPGSSDAGPLVAFGEGRITQRPIVHAPGPPDTSPRVTTRAQLKPPDPVPPMAGRLELEPSRVRSPATTTGQLCAEPPWMRVVEGEPYLSNEKNRGTTWVFCKLGIVLTQWA